jgi:hypothetical protein
MSDSPSSKSDAAVNEEAPKLPSQSLTAGDRNADRPLAPPRSRSRRGASSPSPLFSPLIACRDPRHESCVHVPLHPHISCGHASRSKALRAPPWWGQVESAPRCFRGNRHWHAWLAAGTDVPHGGVRWPIWHDRSTRMIANDNRDTDSADMWRRVTKLVLSAHPHRFRSWAPFSCSDRTEFVIVPGPLAVQKGVCSHFWMYFSWTEPILSTVAQS